jgi:hypothetical protein
VVVVQQHQTRRRTSPFLAAAVSRSHLREQETGQSGHVDFSLAPRPVVVCLDLLNHDVSCGVSGSAQVRRAEVFAAGELDRSVVSLVVEISQHRIAMTHARAIP